MIHSQEDSILINKFKDKALHAYNKDYQTFTDFLDLHEQNLLLSNIKEFLSVQYKFFGGWAESERKVVSFFPKEMDSSHIFFPINCIRIEPYKMNFSDTLSHRDFLGALMNLGIKRHKLGDILCENSCAYVFCISQIAPFIVDNLLMVKNTSVSSVILAEDKPFTYLPKFDLVRGSVSSLRLDSVIKLAFSLSRGNALELIQAGRVYVNSRICEKSSIKITEGSIISVRGLGKMMLQTIGEFTKKGRIYIEIIKYK